MLVTGFRPSRDSRDNLVVLLHDPLNLRAPVVCDVPASDTPSVQRDVRCRSSFKDLVHLPSPVIPGSSFVIRGRKRRRNS